MSKASINAGPEVRALRSIERIKRLDIAMEKAKGRNNPEKVASLLAERNRRAGELTALKDALDGLDL